MTILKVLKNKTTLNIVNVSYSFTQFSTLAKTYTTTAREPSIYTKKAATCYLIRVRVKGGRGHPFAPLPLQKLKVCTGWRKLERRTLKLWMRKTRKKKENVMIANYHPNRHKTLGSSSKNWRRKLKKLKREKLNKKDYFYIYGMVYLFGTSYGCYGFGIF